MGVAALFPLQSKHVSQRFFDPRYPGLFGCEHAGVDYMIKSGANVKAILDGTVKWNKTNVELMNSVLIIEHAGTDFSGNLYGYYGHIFSTLTPGMKITAGSVIGSVKDWSKNSHLHFGVNNSYLTSFWGRTPKGVDPATKGWLNPEMYLTWVDSLDRLELVDFWRKQDPIIVDRNSSIDKPNFDAQFKIRNAGSVPLFIDQLAMAIHRDDKTFVLDMVDKNKKEAHYINNISISPGQVVHFGFVVAYLKNPGNYLLVAKAKMKSEWKELGQIPFTVK